MGESRWPEAESPADIVSDNALLSSHKNLAKLCEITIHEDNAEQKLFTRYLLLEFSLLFSFSIRYVQSADLAFLLLLYLFATFISSMDIWSGRTSQFIPRFEI